MKEPLKIKVPPTPGQQQLLDVLEHEVNIMSALTYAAELLPVNSEHSNYIFSVIRLTSARVTAIETALMLIERSR